MNAHAALERLHLAAQPSDDGLELVPPTGTAKGWDFLGGVPVPLRQHVRDSVSQLIGREPHLQSLKCCVSMGQGSHGPIQRLRYVKNYDDFPALLVAAEYGNVFNRNFYSTHVEGGRLAAVQPQLTHPAFVQAGLVDPKGWFGVFAVAPFVLLVDRRRLGQRPMPRCWADLLEPEFAGEVAFSGWRPEPNVPYRSFNMFLLLAIAREFGIEGLARLLGNVSGLMHTMQMARLAGHTSSCAAIYIVPWFFATLCPRREVTTIVWPEDGALAFPLWLTMKRAESERLSALVDHFYGTDLAAYLNSNCYPAACRERASSLPGTGRLKWIGWDFVRHPAAGRLVRQARALAADLLEASPCA